MKKNKQGRFQIIPNDHKAHDVLRDVQLQHPELVEARIGLAWQIKTKADADSHIVLGRCVKIGELHANFMEYDFIIVLNQEFWNDFSDEQRSALMEHELCHAAQKHAKNGGPKRNESGRILWRIRKHDIEEFREVVRRHGCYKADLEAFAKELLKTQSALPLDKGNEKQI